MDDAEEAVCAAFLAQGNYAVEMNGSLLDHGLMNRKIA